MSRDKNQEGKKKRRKLRGPSRDFLGRENAHGSAVHKVNEQRGCKRAGFAPKINRGPGQSGDPKNASL